MANQTRSKESRNTPEAMPDPGKVKLDDLVYSVETKTISKFLKNFVRNNILRADYHASDPLPKMDLDSIGAEIKKRLGGLDEYTLDSTKLWLRDPLRKLNELIDEEKRRFPRMIDPAQTRERIIKEQKEFEHELAEMEIYRAKIQDLLTAIERAQVPAQSAEKITTATHNEFKQLNLFEDNDHGNG